MITQEDEFLQELQAAFQTEADEHLQAMTRGLLELEKLPPSVASRSLVETIYRDAHSLKGAARAVNLFAIEAVCQALEGVFSAWKNGDLEPAPEQYNPIYQALDLIEELLVAPPNGGQGDKVRELADRLARVKRGNEGARITPLATETNGSGHRETAVEATEPSRPVAVEEPSGAPAMPVPEPAAFKPDAAERSQVGEKVVLSETVRISTQKLDRLLWQAEEMLLVKQSVSQRSTDLRDAAATLALWEKEWRKIEPQVSRARRWFEKNGDARPEAGTPAPNLLDFLEWNHSYIKSLETRLAALAKSTERDRRATGSLVNSLLEDTKKLVMLPFATLLAIFPKLVRDLSHDQKKDVQLLTSGVEVEIDKRILEEMKDPLIHLIRNSIDHGIESPQERERLGKAQRATVSIAVSRVGVAEARIVVTDDGRGMDLARIKASAVRHGMSQAEVDGLTETQALDLIFQSGVSTSAAISEISGRGLGMAIVREKAEKLGGSVTVETTPGAGTTFCIVLPLTLTTFKGILVRAADGIFVVPTSDVERVLRIRQDAVQTVENRETVLLSRAQSGADLVSLVWLAEVLELPGASRVPGNGGFMEVVVLGAREKRIAFCVDAVLNEQEVLVKKFDPPLSRLRNVAGATVLGSGRAVPILNVADLLKSAVRAVGAWTPATARESGSRPKAVLVAEDSITSRMLLKNILESAGYLVTTAVDGMEALTKLKAQEFDAVVSDVEMPRMDGFELTTAMRRDQRLADLPVVLVTGRESREDRERGIDVGASAYIVKSSFDQSNLIDVLKRLI